MSRDLLASAPVALPLAGAALSVLLHRRVVAQQVLGCVVLAALLALDVVLLATVRAEGTVVSDVGGWPAPIGITLAVDLFSAIMLVVSALMLLVVFVYSQVRIRPSGSSCSTMILAWVGFTAYCGVAVHPGPLAGATATASLLPPLLP